MPKYWMISDRAFDKDGPTSQKGPPTYWTSDKAKLDALENWSAEAADTFQQKLIDTADVFPMKTQGNNSEQKHVCFLVHGFNNGFADAAHLYKKVCDNLFSGKDSLGLCISLDWPSLGSLLGYLPDRDHARDCANDIGQIFDAVHQWLLIKQRLAISDSSKACRAKVSIISHSMGNYVVQKALSTVWQRNNQPLSVSLINQLIMVAADVDNDLFEGNSESATNGEAVANLSYRVTSLYSGRDTVLGASAGVKHFGVRRLGRSGLAYNPPHCKSGSQRDNIWEVDCSSFFPSSIGDGLTDQGDIHGAYFGHPDAPQGTYPLIREILRGTDRSVLSRLGFLDGKKWPSKKK